MSRQILQKCTQLGAKMGLLGTLLAYWVHPKPYWGHYWGRAKAALYKGFSVFGVLLGAVPYKEIKNCSKK